MSAPDVPDGRIQAPDRKLPDGRGPSYGMPGAGPI